MGPSKKSFFSHPPVKGMWIVGALLLIVVGTLSYQAWPLHATGSGLVSLPDSVPSQVAGARITGHHNAAAAALNTELTVGIALKPNGKSNMDTLFHNMYDPHNALYHHWLSRGAYATLFGPTKGQLAAIADFLKQSGLHPVAGSTSAFIVLAAGTVSRVEKAFHTQINDYRASDGSTFFANSSAIQLPDTLATSVAGVLGLTDVSVARPLGRSQAAQRKGSTPNYGGGPYGTGLTPEQIQSIYDANPVYNSLHDKGEGVTLGLFELSGYTYSDIRKYEKQFHLPNTKIVNEPSAFGTPNHKGAGEVELDIDMQLALAPNVDSILVYNAHNDALGSILEYGKIAFDDQANAVSTSWGTCEKDMLPFVADIEDVTFLVMALQGQSLFAASGDSGAYDCIDAHGNGHRSLQVDDPASQPFVTGVGGTSFAGNNPASNPDPGYLGNEHVWNNGCTPKHIPDCRRAGGGGVSHTWAMPDYQAGPGVNEPGYSKNGRWCGQPGGTGCREVPDISINADPASGYAIYCTDKGDSDCATYAYKGWLTNGGTSAGAPLWAAIAALIDSYARGQGQSMIGFVNPALYGFDSSSVYNTVFHDIPAGRGNNGYYPAGPNYDMATGLGSPDIYNLLQALLSKPGGNIWLTGHDIDFHCSAQNQSCHYLQVALTFVMKGSTLPVLALDHGTEVATAIGNAFGSSAPTVNTVDPRSGFASLPLVGRDGTPLYSAIVAASDITCGGCDNNDGYGVTPDSDAINARSADIASFVDAGGGILALAGADNFGVFYNFLPVSVTATTVAPPFTLTPYGLSLGLVEGSDDNCCPTHNSFDLPPAGSVYQVAETDSAGLAETLVAKAVLVTPASHHAAGAHRSGPRPHVPHN